MVSSTLATVSSLCHECRGIGWIFIEGRGVKACRCRVQAVVDAQLARIPPEYEHLRLDGIKPAPARHRKQAPLWKAVRKNPDGCYLICGPSGAGKSALIWVLYRRAVERNRPAVAISLAELVEDYRRAEIARSENEYLPRLSPASLQTKSERWFVGLDDFHFGRPTRFAGEMIYRLLDAAYSYRHQLVVTSQLDRRRLEQHWAEAGEGYGRAIMRRVLEIEAAMYLTLFETNDKI